MRIAAISKQEAEVLFEAHSEYRGHFDFAIAAVEEDQTPGMRVNGVIALCANGKEFSLGHIWTDGNAHVGSLLYGAAWRAAKAMGYRTITI